MYIALYRFLFDNIISTNPKFTIILFVQFHALGILIDVQGIWLLLFLYLEVESL